MGRGVLVVMAVLAVSLSVAWAQEPAPPGGPDAPGEVVFTLPPCAGLFPDVPCSNQFARWIEQLYRDRITTGCGGGNYCPDAVVTRGQMAAFLERMARGGERWPPNIVYVFQVYNDNGTPNPTASGQALRDAMAAIPGSGALQPGLDNHYVVRLGPGVYNIGTASFTVRAYTDLEGAGREATVIQADLAQSSHVYLAGSNRISRLSLERDGAVTDCYGFFVQNGAALDDVYVNVANGSSWTIGIYANLGKLTVMNSHILVTGGGGTTAAIYAASGAGSAEVRHSRVQGDTNFFRNGSSSVARIAFCTVSGTAYSSGSGGFACAHNVAWLTHADVTCP